MSRHLPWALAMVVLCAASFLWHLTVFNEDQRLAPGAVPATRISAAPLSTHVRTLRGDDNDARRREMALLTCIAGNCASSHPKSTWSIVELPRQSEIGPLSRGPSLPGFSRSRPAQRPKTRLVALASAPFPYFGRVPRSNRPFLNVANHGRKGRKTYSGRVYWANKTYSDRRVLFHVPKGFDIGRPGVIVLFFHGHGATLERDVVARQRVPEQITDSGMNAVLVAPQFAVDARDSSAGKFWQPGGVRRFLDDAARQLAELQGDAKSAEAFAEMPVIIVGYSGGYVPTAWALANGEISDRVKGVVLLDGLYGELNKFASWIKRDRSAFFLSAYARSTTKGNSALKRILAKAAVPYRTRLGRELKPGSVTFLKAMVSHRHYVTHAWAENPIADVLVRMPDIAARRNTSISASLSPTFTR